MPFNLEHFHPDIKKTIEYRQKILNRGNYGYGGTERMHESKDFPHSVFHQYTTNKQCQVRMASGVDIVEPNILESHEQSLGLIDDGMARQFILQGGQLYSKVGGEEVESTDDINKKAPLSLKRRHGWPSTTLGVSKAYGDITSRANTGDGFGIVPMPGITNVSVRTRTELGSLRDAKVEFTCYNRRQLEILELLYMRPGYPIMLEWAWDPCIDADGIHSPEYITDEIFKSNATYQSVDDALRRNKEKLKGNYDGLIGFCKNYTFKVRPDGGYDCVTEIISKGEIIESLKVPKKTDSHSQIIAGRAKGNDIESYEDDLMSLFRYINQYDKYANVSAKKMAQFTPLMKIEYDRYQKNRKARNEKVENTLHALAIFAKPGSEICLSTQPDKKSVRWINHDGKYKYGLNTTASAYEKRTYNNYTTGYSPTYTTTNVQITSSLDNLSTFAYIRLDALLTYINAQIIPSDQKDEFNNPIAYHTTWVPTTPNSYEEGDEINTPQLYEGNYLDSAIMAPNFPITPDNVHENGRISYSGFSYLEIDNKFLKSLDGIAGYVAQNPDQTYSSGKYFKSGPQLFFNQSYDPHIAITKDQYVEFIRERTGYTYTKTINSINDAIVPNHWGYPSSFLETPGGSGRTEELKRQEQYAIYRGPTRHAGNTDAQVRNTIGDIFINTFYLQSMYSSEVLTAMQKDNNPNVNIGNFIANILNDLSSVFGDRKFTTQTSDQFSNIIEIHERSYDQDNQSFSKDSEKTLKLEILGSKSACREFDYHSEITTAMSATVAVLAQNPDSIEDLEDVTYRAFNKDIRNRLTQRKGNEIGREVYSKEWIKLRERIKTFFSGLERLRQHMHYDMWTQAVEDPFNEGHAREISTIRQLYTHLIQEYKYFYSLDRQSILELSRNEGPLRITSNNLINNESAVIPLKWSAVLDGIGGIRKLQVFKLPKNRLPKSYINSNVHFVVHQISEKITAGQDWSTQLGGQLILMPDKDTKSQSDFYDNNNQEDPLEILVNEDANRPRKIIIKKSEDIQPRYFEWISPGYYQYDFYGVAYGPYAEVKDEFLQDASDAKWILRKLHTTTITYEIWGLEPQEVAPIMNYNNKANQRFKFDDTKGTTPGTGALIFEHATSYFYINTDFTYNPGDYAGFNALSKEPIVGVNRSHEICQEILGPNHVGPSSVEEEFVGDLVLYQLTKKANRQGSAFAKGGKNFKSMDGTNPFYTYPLSNRVDRGGISMELLFPQEGTFIIHAGEGVFWNEDEITPWYDPEKLAAVAISAEIGTNFGGWYGFAAGVVVGLGINLYRSLDDLDNAIPGQGWKTLYYGLEAGHDGLYKIGNANPYPGKLSPIQEDIEHIPPNPMIVVTQQNDGAITEQNKSVKFIGIENIKRDQHDWGVLDHYITRGAIKPKGNDPKLDYDEVIPPNSAKYVNGRPEKCIKYSRNEFTGEYQAENITDFEEVLVKKPKMLGEFEPFQSSQSQ